MKTTYAFHVATELTSGKPFKDIPIPELCEAMRLRLDEIEKTGNREAFSMFDELVPDEPETDPDMEKVKSQRAQERLREAEIAMHAHDFCGLKIIHLSPWEAEGRFWSRILYGETPTEPAEKKRLLFSVEFDAKSTRIASVSASPLREAVCAELTIRNTEICHRCTHFQPRQEGTAGGRIGICQKGNPANPWPGTFSQDGGIHECRLFEPNTEF